MMHYVVAGGVGGGGEMRDVYCVCVGGGRFMELPMCSSEKAIIKWRSDTYTLMIL